MCLAIIGSQFPILIPEQHEEPEDQGEWEYYPEKVCVIGYM